MATAREIIDATLLCEGTDEPDGETPEERDEQLREAWQLLIDTGTVWKLQGWFGRTAKGLIEQGYVMPRMAFARDSPTGRKAAIQPVSSP